jgi:uncharacterized protein (DUF433 family)
MQKGIYTDRLNAAPLTGGAQIFTSKLSKKNKTLIPQGTAKTCAAIAISSLASMLLGQPASVSQPARPRASAEMQRLLDAFSGTWSTTIKFVSSDKRSPAREPKGTEVWRRGPGGLSIIEDYQSIGVKGDVFGLAIGWWDEAGKRYQFLRCESTDSEGCHVLKREPKWEDGQLALMEERQENGLTLAIKEVFSDITPTMPGPEVQNKMLGTLIMDWSGCPLVETRPDVQRGRPVVRGTRVTVKDSIIGNWEAGVDAAEIAELFPAVTVEQIGEILSYAARHQVDVPSTA